MEKKRLSIVVPVYNEEDNLHHFYEAVRQTMAGLDLDWEIIFVDDGSRDKSRAILAKLEREDARVQPMLLARNYGHQLALTCGLDHADGDVVITMDGDMQHPPELIPELLKYWHEGYDVVQTIRDATRGGVGTVLHEIAAESHVGIELSAAAIPVAPEVRGVCGLLGLEPLYLACEGRLIIFAPQAIAPTLVEVLRTLPDSRQAAVIGRVTPDFSGRVVLNTEIGTKTLLPEPSGELLPRIC